MYKLLESDKQVVGPVSTQAPLDWRLGEWGDEFIGVYTDANIDITDSDPATASQKLQTTLLAIQS
jgi:hypothetical protein